MKDHKKVAEKINEIYERNHGGIIYLHKNEREEIESILTSEYGEGDVDWNAVDFAEKWIAQNFEDSAYYHLPKDSLVEALKDIVSDFKKSLYTPLPKQEAPLMSAEDVLNPELFLIAWLKDNDLDVDDLRIHAPKVMRAYAKHIIESLTDEVIEKEWSYEGGFAGGIGEVRGSKWARQALLNRLNARP